MFELRELTAEDFESALAASGVVVPIEQTPVWAAYQDTIEGRTTWGYFALTRDGADAAYVTFTDYETHGYHYLRAHHGPIWIEEPSEQDETEAMEALVSYVHARDHRQVFMRLAVDHELPMSSPTLSSIPYDTTVIIDLTGGDEAILSRMKPRGRRDVRKALRESPITCVDETDKAAESFEEYYAVMAATADRDGFVPAPCSEYETMIRLLGREHCRVYVGRLEDGTVANWNIVTISGTRAVNYYAASSNETMRMHVVDKLLYHICCDLGKQGLLDFDLMAIGSDFSPSLMGLNEFKTKFCKEVAHVAPDRDVPIKKLFYRSLHATKGVISAVRSHS